MLESMIAELEAKQKLTPAFIVEHLINYCWNITEPSRQWMEQNIGKKLPSDYITFPGKLDHTTCVAIRVGVFS